MALAWRPVDLRRLLVTAICLVAWRALDQIVVIGVDVGFVARRIQAVDASGRFAALGGQSVPVAPYSLGAIGLEPYVTALIVGSLGAVISKPLRDMAQSHDGGIRLQRWIRVLAVALAAGGAYGWTVLLQSEGALPESGMDWSARFFVIAQVTAGTAIAILLADAIDRFGFGFGFAALGMFALERGAQDWHRMADLVSTRLSLAGLFSPLLIWAAFALCATALTVAALLAVRPISLLPRGGEQPATSGHIPLLITGVLRPPYYSFALMSIVPDLAGYLRSSHPSLAEWFSLNWTSTGPNVELDVLYVALETALVIAAAVFVATCDCFAASGDIAKLTAPAQRLAALGGMVLGVVAVVFPVLEYVVTRAAGQTVLLSGADLALLTAVIVIAVHAVERRPPPALVADLPTQLP